MTIRFAKVLLVAAMIAVSLLHTHVQGTHADSNVPVVARVLGTTIRTQDAEEVRYRVLRALTDRYADEKGIAVTQAEQDAYIKRVQDALKRDREHRQAQRDALARQLAGEGLGDTERKSLATKLDEVNKSLAALAEPAGNPEEIKAARDQIAAAFIRQWKINKALYQEYRGRIIFQQGGPEPLDAYRRFLEERQARGDFALLDEKIEAAFWRYYLTDAIHSFYAPGSKEEARVFETPPWLSKN